MTVSFTDKYILFTNREGEPTRLQSYSVFAQALRVHIKGVMSKTADRTTARPAIDRFSIRFQLVLYQMKLLHRVSDDKFTVLAVG